MARLVVVVVVSGCRCAPADEHVSSLEAIIALGDVQRLNELLCWTRGILSSRHVTERTVKGTPGDRREADPIAVTHGDVCNQPPLTITCSEVAGQWHGRHGDRFVLEPNYKGAICGLISENRLGVRAVPLVERRVDVDIARKNQGHSPGRRIFVQRERNAAAISEPVLGGRIQPAASREGADLDPFREPELAGPSRVRHSRWPRASRSEEHTSELQSRQYLVCRLLL